jgi:serine/threonine protein kinase
MELLKGKTLETKLAEDGQMHLNECLHIMKQITAALSLIHSKNIIHRDLKPSNIMLVNNNGDNHFVKLLDFGVARMKFQTKLTRTGILLGTTNYLAPEQINNSGISTASDLFSLGIIFYEMVCGTKPFTGDSESDIIKDILEKQPMEPQRLRDDVPQELNTLIMRMLEKRKESRPSGPKVQEILHTINNNL